MGMSYYANPFATQSRVSAQHTSGNSCTRCSVYTPMIFPDGQKVGYTTASGRCSGTSIEVQLTGEDPLLMVMGYLCVSGTNCIYNIRPDTSGYGAISTCTSGTNKYTICSPGGDVYYNYIIWFENR